MDSQLGTIEAGKIANIVLADGDIFQDATRVRQVFVDGRRFELKDDAKPASGPKPGKPAAGGAR